MQLAIKNELYLSNIVFIEERHIRLLRFNGWLIAEYKHDPSPSATTGDRKPVTSSYNNVTRLDISYETANC